MATVTTGRTLDGGDPVPGTGFAFDPEGDLAALLRERTGPITSHSTRPAWAAPLPADDDTIRSVSVFGPGYGGPPEHYHEVSEEAFDVRRGTVVFDCDGDERRVTAGERLAVPTGTRHTFRAAGDGLAVVVTEISPPGRIGHVLPTLGGIAHDDAVDADSPLQRAVIADRLAGDTTFTEIDPRLTRPIASLLAPVARLRGYRGAYGKYQQDAFWRRHVEQPDV
ncbi:MAG: cupin domain-containing protein [Haloferacaceae archaeon]